MRRFVGILVLVIALAACVERLTEEQRVLRAATEIRAALTGTDADEVWDLASTRNRNVTREIRLQRAGRSEGPAPVPEMLSPSGEGVRAVSSEDAARMSDREFHRRVFLPWEDLAPISASAGVRIDGEQAVVDDVASRSRWWLRREDGDWKLDVYMGGPFYDLEPQVYTGTGGREYICGVFADLTFKKLHSVPLPKVAGDAPLDMSVGLRMHVALDLDGVIVLKGDRIDLPELSKRTLVFAERMRDMDTPLMLSVVHVCFAVHRDLPWRRVDTVLRVCADGDIRIQPVEFLTSEEVGRNRAIPVRLGARYPVRIKFPVPEIEIRAGRGSITPERLAALGSLLGKAADEAVEKGIRLEVDAGIEVGPVLELLLTVARRKPPEILCYPRDDLPGKLTVGGVEVHPVTNGNPDTTPVTIPLTIDLRE